MRARLRLNIERTSIMSESETVLQIVPHQPGTFDGVGDYALNLARALESVYGIRTTFLVAGSTSTSSKGGFDIISGLDLEAARGYSNVILHYVNYGYQSRGVPFELRTFVKQLRAQSAGRWVTTFHELYASGPPWTSAFWLRPFQVRIARAMIDAATACVVSNTAIETAIHKYDAGKQVYLVPVMSNFGEPELGKLAPVSPKRWAICGGTALIKRSLQLFVNLLPRIPPAFAPNHLDVVGGRADSSITAALDKLKGGMSVHHYPEVTVDLASEVLRQAAFGFIDYFGSGKVWPNMVLKSTAFAALCAHGVVPVLSHQEGPITVDGDALPGPYFLTSAAIHLPAEDELPSVHRRCFAWYQAHAHSRCAAQIYAEALR